MRPLTFNGQQARIIGDSAGPFTCCSVLLSLHYGRLRSGQPSGPSYSCPFVLLLTAFRMQANEILHHKMTLNGYLAEFTGQTIDKVYVDTDRDFFLSAQESVEYGLIDAVISKPTISLAAAASNGNAAALVA